MTINLQFHSFKECLPTHNQSFYYFYTCDGLLGLKQGYAYYIFRDKNGNDLDDYPDEFGEYKDCETMITIQNVVEDDPEIYCELSIASFPDIYWIDLDVLDKRSI